MFLDSIFGFTESEYASSSGQPYYNRDDTLRPRGYVTKRHSRNARLLAVATCYKHWHWLASARLSQALWSPVI